MRADVFARYRVSHDPYEWGVSGYSSGGYCAANLALRHRRSFGAAAVIEGYFRAADGPAATALNHSQPLEAANSPLYLAERLTPGSGPLPAFWVAAGTHDATDYRPATMFTAALNRFEQVPFIKLKNAKRFRQRLAGRPARRAGLAVAAAGTARPARPVPGAHHGRRHRHPAGQPGQAAPHGRASPSRVLAAPACPAASRHTRCPPYAAAPGHGRAAPV